RWCDWHGTRSAAARRAGAVFRNGRLVCAMGRVVVGVRGVGAGVPDISFAGYLAGPKVGAIAYNALHTAIGPIALALAGFALAAPLTLSIALIWLAHIGIDRALGYGLKYPAGFGFTHLGRIGR